MDDGTPTPNRKKKKFSLSPFPQNPKKEKIGCTDYILSLPQCLLDIFIMGQYPFITGWIPIVQIIGQNGQFPETMEFCNLRSARALPPLFALYVRSAGQTGVHRARWVGQIGRGTSPGPPSLTNGPALGVRTFQVRCDSFRDLVSVSYGSKSKTLQNPRHRQMETFQDPRHR
jgi:hypothetical protein